jgi:hypothetical protein
VVDVRLDDASYEFLKDASHTSLERGARFFEPERHRLVAVSAEWSDERGCELICNAHRYLVVPGVRIKKIESFAPSR